MGGSIIPATGLYSVGKLARNLVSKSQAAKACSGSSTVPAVVVIVVKHRACLSVGRLIVGVQTRSFSR